MIVDDEVIIVMIVMILMIMWIMMIMMIVMITILTINSVIQLSPTGAPPNIATPCYWTLTSTLFLWWGWWSWWWQSWWWWRWHAAMHSRKKKRNLGIWPWAYNADGENHFSFAFHGVIQWPSSTKSSDVWNVSRWHVSNYVVLNVWEIINSVPKQCSGFLLIE